MFYDRYNKYSHNRRADFGAASEKAEASPLPVARFRRKTQVSTLVDKFTRDKYTNTIDSALCRDSSPNADQINRDVIRQVQLYEESSLRSREETAQKNILKSIQSQKYG